MRVYLLILLVLIAGCASQKEVQTEFTDEELSEILADLPESRSFYMGVGGFPYANNLDALKETNEFVDKHSELSLAHFEVPPWNDILTEGEYSNIKYIDSVKEKYEGDRLFLMLGYSDNSGDKKKIAGDWSEKDLDDPDVLEAYLSYSRFMINKFRPDYFAYATEINRGYVDGEEGFEKVLEFNENVYTVLKSDYPKLPIFITLTMTDSNIDNFNSMRSTYTRLLEHSDYIVLSVYPYLPRSTGPFNGGDTNPENLPDVWFTRMQELAPEKPIAISESGYPAEKVSNLIPPLSIESNPQWQLAFYQKLFRNMNDLDAEFVFYTIHRDADAWGGTIGTFNGVWAFENNGMLDEDGNVRPVLALWDGWLGLEKQ